MKTIAGINGPKMKGNGRHPIRRMLRWLMIVCAAFFTLVILLVLEAQIYLQYRYVQLPNGTSLAATEWFEEGIVLRNSNGDIVVQPDIDGVVWNDRFVMGWRWIHGQDDIFFIYRIGDPAAVETGLNDDNADAYRRLVKQSGLSGLSGSKEIGTHHYSSTYQNYLDLIQNLDYQRAWYE